MRQHDPDRRALLRAGALGLTAAWTVPVLQSVSVAQAVASPAPDSGATSSPRTILLLAAGSATIVWKDGAGNPAGPVPRECSPRLLLGPPPLPGEVALLSADSGAMTSPQWTGEFASNLFTHEPGNWSAPGPFEIPQQRWATAGFPYLRLLMYPSTGGLDPALWPVSDPVSWSDLWLIVR